MLDSSVERATTEVVSTTEPVPLALAFTAGPLLVAFGLAVAAMGVAGWRGILARNAVLGIRTPRTLATEATWMAAHRAAGPWLVAAALGSIVPGAVVLFRPANETFVLTTMVGLSVLVGMVAVAALMAGQAAAKVAPESGCDSPDLADN